MTLVGRAGVALLAAVLLGGVSAGSAPETPHQVAIDQTIDDALAWLGANQDPNGSWSAAGDNFVAGAGFGAMAFMRQGYDEAALYSGRLVVADAIAFILSQQKPAGWEGLSYTEGSIFWGGDPPDAGSVYHSNYETSVAVMALAMTGNSDYDDEIAAATAWLDKDQWDEQYPNKVGDPEDSVGEEWLGGFGYQCMVPADEDWSARPDLSNSQLSLVALAAAGAITADVAEDAITYIHNCQGLDRDPENQINLLPGGDLWCAANVIWDPTGTQIAYNSAMDAPDEACGLYVQRVDVAEMLVADMGSLEISRARYNSAADKIAFTASEPGADHLDIYLVNRDGTGLTELPGMPEQHWGAWELAWSPDGTKLAITACLTEEQEQPDVYIYDLATDTLGPGLGIAMCAWNLDWSPARRGPYADKIIYTSCITGPASVWMVDVNTKVTADLTVGMGFDCAGYGRWSPDGSRIAFSASPITPEGQGGICLMDPDGSNLDVLTELVEGSEPRWSPDGTKLLFLRGGSLVLANSDGTDPRTVPPFREIGWLGDWRVDGQDWLLYLPGAGSAGKVCWLEFAPPVQLSPCGSLWSVGHAGWSPAGDRISFEAPHNILDPPDPNGESCVWVVDADGASPPVNVSGEGPADWPTWSPDGSKLAFAARFDLFGLPGDWPPESGTECDMPSVWVVDPDGVAPPLNLSGSESMASWRVDSWSSGIRGT